MCMLTRRVHLLLDEERYLRVATAAKARKVSVAEVVREAIDAAIPPHWSDRVSAGDAILAAAPMEVPETVEGLRAELDALRGRRG
jgi:hypothetical protein